MSLMLQAALEYAALGWAVFPCRADKMPLTEHGVLDASADESQIREWWERYPDANIGFNVGAAGLVAIDYDPGSKRSDLSGLLPGTSLIARTPRGGTHEFYSLDGGEVVAPSASKIAPNVDVRSFNSYVLLAPSRTADGEYTWVERGPAVRRTDEFVRLANIAKEKSADREKWIIDPDLPENVELASEWLATKAKIATDGHGGDQCAYDTACMMVSYGISEELAFDLMLQHWNPRCDPPWVGDDDMDHLRDKVKHGYAYYQNPPGNVTPAYHSAKSRSLFSPIVRDGEGNSGKEATNGRFHVVDWDGMQALQPPSWIIQDFIPREASVLVVGAPGTFKTFIALDALLSIAAAEAYPWAGTWAGEVVQSGPVALAVGEGRSGIKQRAEAWSEHYLGGRKVPGFHLAWPVPLVLEKPEEFIAALKAMSSEYVAIGLDTVSKSMRGADENSASDAGLYDQMVRAIIEEFKCSVLSIAHTGHENTKRQRGSNAFEGDCDTVMMTSLYRGDVKLAVTRQKDAAEWDKARYRAMKDVGGSKVPTLSERKASDPEPVEDDAPKDRKKRKPAIDQIVLEVVDNAAVAVLSQYRARRWTLGDLVNSIALRPEVEIGSEKVKAALKVLRETKSAKVQKHFDASVPAQGSAGQWCYKD